MNKDFAPYPHLKNSYRRQIVEKYLFIAIFEVTVFPRRLHEISKEAIAQKKVPLFVGTEGDFYSWLSAEDADKVIQREKRRFCDNSRARLLWERQRILSCGLLSPNRESCDPKVIEMV